MARSMKIIAKARHPVHPSCGGELCAMCYHTYGLEVGATHKVGEELTRGDRHNFTNYVCCKHFTEIMGPMSMLFCYPETHSPKDREND